MLAQTGARFLGPSWRCRQRYRLTRPICARRPRGWRLTWARFRRKRLQTVTIWLHSTLAPVGRGPGLVG